MTPTWSTACPDWEERIIAGKSLVPFDPLFPAEAEAALAIFRDLVIVDAPGRPTFAQAARPWVFDFVAAIFGAYDTQSGRRLIREFLLNIAKKNIKSTLLAGVMVTALVRNWRDDGEYYILSPTKEVADNSFNPARGMVNADPDLHAMMHVQQNIRRITHRKTGAFVKVVAADSETVGGKKTIGLGVDELWQFGKRANAEAMIREAKGGHASRPEGFAIYATTQGDHAPAGVHLQKLDEFRGIRDGKIIDPSSFGLSYEFPERMIKSGEFRRRENFYIPNPNLGLSVDHEYLISEMGKAERAGISSLTNFFAKHLNVQPGIAFRSDGWAGAEVWNRGIDERLRSLDDLLARIEVATVGCDGGGLDDLFGEGVIGREKNTKRWLGWGHALISIEGLKRRKANAEDYARFKREGTLTVFTFAPFRDDNGDFLDPELKDFPPELFEDVLIKQPNAVHAPDVMHFVDLVTKIRDLGLLAQVGVDAAGIGSIVDALAEIEVTQDAETLDAVRQGIALMGAVKTLERKCADGTFRHGGTQLMSWCVGNVRIVPTPTAMRVARDESGFGKVDPFMALANASHLMSLNPEAGSAYTKDRGLFIVDLV